MTKALEISKLCKTYDNGFQALKTVSVTVEQGDFFALLGPNGAGKSTTLGIVSSLVNKTSGNVSIFGHDLETDLVKAKTCLGVVPQEFNFNQFEKVRDILITQAGYYGIPAVKAKESADFYLKKLGLWDKKDIPSRMLSGGMKRRLMIARALVHNPKLLILDEPTAGVDIELRRSMWTFLKELNEQGTTIILTTHYLEEAEALCRNIAIIDKGEILENTSMKTLLKTLNIETFILETSQPLVDAPDLSDFVSRINGEGMLEVDVKRDQNISQLFECLKSFDWVVTSIRSKSNRLEELFLGLLQKNNQEKLI
jgi:ABC-2 type transport system ATP-binding protein